MKQHRIKFLLFVVIIALFSLVFLPCCSDDDDDEEDTTQEVDFSGATLQSITLQVLDATQSAATSLKAGQQATIKATAHYSGENESDEKEQTLPAFFISFDTKEGYTIGRDPWYYVLTAKEVLSPVTITISAKYSDIEATPVSLTITPPPAQ